MTPIYEATLKNLTLTFGSKFFPYFLTCIGTPKKNGDKNQILWQIWTWNPLILWVIGIRLKGADSEASRCRDINFYRKKHRCFKSSATLTYEGRVCQSVQKISETISMTCEDILFVDGVLPDVDLLIRHLIRWPLESLEVDLGNEVPLKYRSICMFCKFSQLNQLLQK